MEGVGECGSKFLKKSSRKDVEHVEHVDHAG